MAVTSWTTAGSGQNSTALASGTYSWSSPGRITANDNSDTVAGTEAGGGAATNGATDALRAYNFGFSIPSSAQIDDVEVRYERWFDDGGSGTGVAAQERTIRLSKNGTTYVGDNKSDSSTYESTRTLAVRGGDSDGWNASLSPADVNATSFSVGIEANIGGGGFVISNGKIDYVQMRIYYATAPADPTGISVSQVNDNIEITWTDNATDEDNYEIQRNIDGGGWVSLSSSLAANTESYTDSPPLNDSSIQYRVRATKTGGATSSFDTASAFNYTPHTGRGSPISYY